MNLPEKVCAIPECGAVFKPKSGSATFCSPKHEKKCVECDDGFAAPSRTWSERHLCRKCCRRAAAAKGRATMLVRHGVENAMQLDSTKEKAKATTRAKHGVDHYTQTQEYRDKVKVTNLENHGVEHTFQRDDVKGKIAETLDERYGGHHLKTGEVLAKQHATNMERYGVENVAQNDDVRAKIKRTNMERYGEEVTLLNPEVAEKRRATWEENHGGHPMQNEAFRAAHQKQHSELYGVPTPFHRDSVRAKARGTMLERYGVEYALQAEEFLAKQQESLEVSVAAGLVRPSRISKLNERFAEVIRGKFDVTVTLEKRIGSHSFDLAIEDASLLIELNPTISHNSMVAFPCVRLGCTIPCGKHRPLREQYHFKRAQAAQAEGYSLIQVYDWDSEDAILRLLAGKLEKGFTRHSSRKLGAVKIQQKEANSFLAEHHIQGGVNGQDHCYGLKNDFGELVAVATFGKARFGAQEEWEWLRYAVAQGHIVHGGPNRLWRMFQADVAPASAVSYVDFDHTTAQNIFLTGCGFAEGSPTGPSKVWSRGDKRVYHNSLLRLGADRLLRTSYGSREESGLDNEVIMLLEGWLPVHTAGNRVFRWVECDVT